MCSRSRAAHRGCERDGAVCYCRLACIVDVYLSFDVWFRLQKHEDFLDWHNIFEFVVNLEHLYSFVLEHGLDGWPNAFLTTDYLSSLEHESLELHELFFEHGLDGLNGCAREYSLIFLLLHAEFAESLELAHGHSLKSLLGNTNCSNDTNVFLNTDWTDCTDERCLQDFVLVAVVILCLI